MEKFAVNSSQQTQIIDITSQVQSIVSRNDVEEGICHVFVPHTTAGITINENADPDVKADMLKEINKIIPYEDNYRHLEGNSAAHIKASLFGNSQAIIIENSKLQLGTWQGVFFCEFDGPRSRKVWVNLTKS
jgi:secondary thiamine-phosphate synthase enzyme